ncbi:hypothetical protein ILUMI_04582 [Ignelater luminosus]|uniref:Uncharacterized protein n=1 Tax=Ignelater luminosus TaxID=2038154 RepID=A0A8K0GL09_IGNLU|nr:hypothetical protein ILUMI_04582 [Ignelater luminosus]
MPANAYIYMYPCASPNGNDLKQLIDLGRSDTWSEKIEEQTQKKRKAYMRWLNTNNDNDRKEYRQIQKETQRIIRKEREKAWELKCSEIGQVHRRQTLYRDLEIYQEHKKERQAFIPTSESKMKFLKNDKSSGPEGISAELIKYGSYKLYRMIDKLFKMCINGQRVPDEWRLAHHGHYAEEEREEYQRRTEVMESWRKSMGEIQLNEGEWNDRRQWKLRIARSKTL